MLYIFFTVFNHENHFGKMIFQFYIFQLHLPAPLYLCALEGLTGRLLFIVLPQSSLRHIRVEVPLNA